MYIYERERYQIIIIMYRKITSTIIVDRVSIFLLCENDDECTFVVRRGNTITYRDIMAHY